MELERTDRLAIKPSDQEWLDQVRRAADPFAACRLLDRPKPRETVHLIDNLDQLTAAFMIIAYRFRVQERDFFAEQVVSLARSHKIRGSAGLCYARDLVYKETGFFAGL